MCIRDRALEPSLTSPTGSESPYGVPDWRPLVLGFNTRVTPWDRAETRWAVNHSIDRDELLRVGELGRGQVAALPFPAFPAFETTVADLTATPDLPVVGSHDAGRSDDLFAGQGYVRAMDGRWVRDGEPLSLSIVTSPAHAEVAAVLVAQLRRAGITVTVETPPEAASRIRQGLAVAWLWPLAGGVRDPHLTLDRYHGRHVRPTGEATVSPARWADAGFDAAVDRLRALPPESAEARREVVAAMAIWLAALPEIPLLQTFNRIPLGTRYWVGWPGAAGAAHDPASWRATFLPSLTALRPAPPTGEGDPAG